ncbi:MAG: methylenetetrahydrofolate reductase [NAD(P)H] [Pseudomonadota bacterium]
MSAPAVSFEVFPPRSIDASFKLWETAQALAPLEPRFFSVTYGAGGSTRDLTHDAAYTLHKSSGLPVAAHLTCVGATKAETLAVARRYATAGITDLVALRGDPPEEADRFTPLREGFASSVDLIDALSQSGQFTLRVGAYPEQHPEAANPQADIDWLKAKLDAGAVEAITQFFFEAETFLRFRDACADAGITAPITPGILPVANWASARKFAKRCGTTIPAWLDQGFETAIRDNRQELFAQCICTELCSALVEEGVDSLHFYTLNQPDLTRSICHALGITPSQVVRDVA